MTTAHRLLRRLPVRAVTAALASLSLVTLGLVAVPTPPAHAMLTSPAQVQALAQGVTVTNPGGDLAVSMSDPSISSLSSSELSGVLSSYYSGLGLSDGASLNSVIQDEYSKMAGANTGFPPPPTFSSGSLSASGDTVTADLPAADVPIGTSAAPPTGAVNGPFGLCLDGSDQSQVELNTCDGSANQTWTYTNGELETGGGLCLDTNGAALVPGGGTWAVLNPCSGAASQQWQAEADGSVQNPASGLCLDDWAGVTTAGARVQVWYCSYNSAPGGFGPGVAANQTFTLPTSPTVSPVPGFIAGVIGSIVGAATAAMVYVACMAVFIVALGGLPAVLALPWTVPLCTSMSFFFWSFIGILVFDLITGVSLTGPGAVKEWTTILGYSLATAAIGAAWPFLATWVEANLAETFLVRAITWISDGLNGLAGWLGGTGNAAAAAAAVEDVVQGAVEAIEMNPVEVLQPAFEAAGMATGTNTGTVTSGFAGNCMDAPGGTGDTPGQIVAINTCNGNSSQNWTTWSDNNVSVFGLCLDTVGGGTAEGTLVDLDFCDGSSTQVWQQVGDSLVNQASEMCLDDPNSVTNAGTQLRIWACNGATAQQWILPGNTLHPTGSAASLRVLPFGDSITYGYQSSDGSGYRCDLQSLLSGEGDTYQFAGSLNAGSGCTQEENEGHSGWTIPELAGIEPCTIAAYQPNVVLLDIGTNDINNGGSVSTAVSNIESLIQSIFADDPGVTVLDGGLIPTPNATVAANMEQFDQEVSAWISQQQSSGVHVAFVSMSAITTSDLADGLHPDDYGYSLMADAWNLGITQAAMSGWIKNANPQGAYTCSSSSSGGGSSSASPPWDGVGLVANGPGGNLLPGSQIEFATVFGTGRDDYLYVQPNSSVIAWYNDGIVDGQVDWDGPMTIAGGVGVPGSQIEFANLTGNGLADYLDVNPASGAVTAWQNDGPAGDTPRSWTSLGQIATGTGAPGSEVRFADLTGNGLDDYIVVNSNSSAQAWLNGGPDSSAPDGWLWLPAGTIAAGVGAPGSQIQFADLEGDGRADYLDVNPSSSVDEWLNGGQDASAQDGWNWTGEGEIALGVGVPGSEIQFGDLTGSGRADYLEVNPTTGAVAAWLNGTSGWTSGGGCPGPSGCGTLSTSGSSGGSGPAWDGVGLVAAGPGGTLPPGSQIEFAPVYGSGRDDYLYVQPNSSVNAWYNAGFSNGQVNWQGPTTIAGGVGVPGSQIQFATLTDDGLADYLDVDPANGAVTAWQNDGPASGSGYDIDWSSLGQIASGTGAPGSEVRFADLTGDGVDDYVVVNPDSSVDAWLNGGPDASAPNGWLWLPAGTIASGVGVPGSQIRFADIEGDGRDDYLNVNPDSSVDEYFNGGPDGSAQDGWTWTDYGEIASGVGAPGSQIQFADLTGSGRDDYLNVNPSTGAVAAWINGG
jgi:lysophospholipase L1-like esterase